MKPLRLVRYSYLHALRLRGPVESLARGAAIGAAVGVTPTIPLHTLAIALLAWLFRGNLVAGILASYLLCNPITIVPLYHLAWVLGSLVLPGELTWDQVQSFLLQLESRGFLDSFAALSELGWRTLRIMLVGGLMQALPVGVISYFLARRFFHGLEERGRARRRKMRH